ncbi:GNAT family N-acetyltransferase [Actinacidiphila glaucinigra]|uniref:GNAT family N-acetyltransferase n=1 Tax=Actinacidiphila glaucinigra TaxID=235986 RepID=UPI002E300823|nr:GNAT family N-acetyltransferase [Actinacidiphila glaucinigra]
MTTTLRPAGPEQRRRGGVRARRFHVCVNGRPVGETTLSTDVRFGPEAGRIVALRIDHDQQRRGRGTVAALAAEEVLRGWGCRRIEVSVRAQDTAALRLAGVLGYTVRNRSMLKALPDVPPALPEGSVVRPMTEAEYPGWAARKRDEYVRSWTRRGVPEAQTLARAEADDRAALPEGLATPGALLLVLEAGGAGGAAGEAVGDLWVGRGEEGTGFVFHVRVAEGHRGRGHGRTLMLGAERECLAAGLERLGLNVFAGNEAAEGLYASLGYEVTEVHLAKPLV